MKKWTYLVAALLTLGSTSVLTGCIDNDEPAGISALRTAKAELIAAKKAVEEAKAAETLANAALIQAQVKTEEANAAKIQAEAEIAKAEAAIKQAQADYLAAQTETERACAQAIIEANERAQKEWEEYAAVRAAQAEAAIADAEAQIARAKANYQAAIASLLTSQTNALLPYVNDLDIKLTAYYNALDALIAAQRDLNDQQKVVDDNEANKELMTRQLQLDLATAEATLKGEQKAQTEAEAALEEAQTLQASELAGKYEEYKALVDNFNLQIADLSVEAAEKIYALYTSGRVAEVTELEEEYYQYFFNGVNLSEEDEVTLEALVMDHGNGSGLPDWYEQGEVEKYSEITYSDRASFYWSYEYGIRPAIESIVDEYRDLTRDANDNEWTAERIALLEAELKTAEDNMTALKKSWQEAVNAYHTGKYNNNIGDYTAISGYAAVSEALAAYNAEIVALNALYKDIKGYEDAEDAAAKARNKAYADAATAQTNAYNAASTAYNSSMTNISTLFATRQAALKKVYDDAKAETDAALKAYDESTSTDAAVLAALYRVYLDKKAVSDEANTAYTSYTIADTQAEIQKVYDDAITAADKTYNDAVTAATKTYNDAWEVGKGTQRLLWDKAVADAADGEADFNNDFIEPLRKAIVAYNKNLPEISYNFDYSPINSYDPLFNYWSAVAPGQTRKELTEANLFQLSKSSLTDVVIMRSIALYGAGNSQNPYGDFDARLVELSDDAIKSELKADENLTTYQQYCNAAALRYGAAGKVIALKAQIELANSWLNNGEQIKKLIAQAEGYLADLDSLYEEIETESEKKEEAWQDAQTKLDADKLATLDPIQAKWAELQPLQDLYRAYTNALGAYVLNVSDNNASDLESWIQTCETAIDNAKLAVYNAETAVMQAKKDLEDWNAGDLTILEMKQRAVEDAQTKVDRAKEAMDKAQAALDAAVALFETAE